MERLPKGFHFLLFLVGLMSGVLSHADPIEDNSFFVEEAYNQETGVVQFIQTLLKPENSNGWTYTFINEIPIKSELRQFSYEVPIGHLESDGKTEFQDVKLNYRQEFVRIDQYVTTGRLSATLPTGDEELGLGQGAPGLEASLITSATINGKWVQHWNLGYGYTPSAKNAAGDTADIQKMFWGVSNVYLFRDRLNLMLEIFGTHAQEVTGQGSTAWTQATYFSPSLRYAIDHKGWQYVPGLAIPVSVGADQGETQVLLYLSIEGKMF